MEDSTNTNSKNTTKTTTTEMKGSPNVNSETTFYLEVNAKQLSKFLSSIFDRALEIFDCNEQAMEEQENEAVKFMSRVCRDKEIPEGKKEEDIKNKLIEVAAQRTTKLLFGLVSEAKSEVAEFNGRECGALRDFFEMYTVEDSGEEKEVKFTNRESVTVSRFTHSENEGIFFAALAHHVVAVYEDDFLKLMHYLALLALSYVRDEDKNGNGYKEDVSVIKKDYLHYFMNAFRHQKNTLLDLGKKGSKEETVNTIPIR